MGNVLFGPSMRIPPYQCFEIKRSKPIKIPNSKQKWRGWDNNEKPLIIHPFKQEYSINDECLFEMDD